MEEAKATVADSTHGIIPEGTTFNVMRDSTNQFTDRRVLTLEIPPAVDIPNRSGSLQVYTKPGMNRWTEIHVGLSREHESITLAE